MDPPHTAWPVVLQPDPLSGMDAYFSWPCPVAFGLNCSGREGKRRGRESSLLEGKEEKEKAPSFF